ncbi:uncharacterized protein BDR25DRAFT_385225 [Lindgomyces ingoldianus]|uniref:Uncharacterized protein n=1 Tax=Lindgomyces ingoldianus TaxID=673940 RepID=A0ACB6Q8X5_9PLEO|nr:uncharacterized protein BDR25DRAFT_385225 [Lindgomyces ingoldianus]KAF2463043.1 hypothetical protein BDR25DRAFT_385225 [Lindgomyces ingoldianus]
MYPNLILTRCLLLWTFTSSTVAACLQKPLSFAIQDLELANKANVRGISLGIGSPLQNISILASADYNETYIYGPNGYCESGFSTTACMTFRGGAYSLDNSSTKITATTRFQSDRIDAQWMKDTCHLQSNISLENFAFGIPNKDLNQAYVSQAQLGLGRNSSLLNTLKKAERISSRAYSIFWGLASGPVNQQTPGSLILGGFDQSLAGNGENFTAALNYKSNCSTGMLVTINDMSLNWPNGSDMSIFMGSQSSVIQACIAPHFAGLMTMPFDYWNNMRALIGGTYLGDAMRSKGFNFFTVLFEPDGVYYGDLTISLQNGISIRIPNTQLVVPEPLINQTTGAVVQNTSVRNIPINPIQNINENDLPVIGRLFFSSAMVLVNHDSQEFTLWQADGKGGGERAQLRVVDESGGIGDVFCYGNGSLNGNSTGMPSSMVPSATSAPALVSHSTARLSGGAVGGIVIGVIVALAVISGICFFLFRKRQRHRAEAEGKHTEAATIEGMKPPTPPYHSHPNFRHHPAEMPTGDDEKVELEQRVTELVDPVELDSWELRR